MTSPSHSFTASLSCWATLVLAAAFLASCGGGDTDGQTADEAPSAVEEELPSSLSRGEYNRLRDALDNDEVPYRIVRRVDESQRYRFDDLEAASRALVDALNDGDLSEADKVFASAPGSWRNDLMNAADDVAFEAMQDNDYAEAYVVDRFMHVDTTAYWILDADYIHGRVVEKDSGSPVAGATISFDERHAEAAQSDDSGEFRLLMPTTRSSGLRIVHPDHDEKLVFNTASGAPISPQSLAGQILEIELGTGYPRLTFRGRLVDAESGAPLAGFPVIAGFDPIPEAAELNLQQMTGRFSRETDTDGRFEITDLPVQNVHLIAQSLVDGKIYVLQERNFRFEEGVDHVIEVQPKEARLQVPLIVLGTVKDRVTGEPVAGARVSAGGWKAERSDQNGRIMMHLDLGKEWQLIASHAEYHDSEPQQLSSSTSKTVETEFLISPITTGTILGTAINATTGEPIANAVIELAGRQVRTDSQGRFRAEEIESGEVTVSGAQSGYRADSESLLLEALQTAEATLELQPITTGTVTGIVVATETGAPIVDATVSAGDQQTMSDENGRFTIEEVEAGEVTVGASKALFVPGNSAVSLQALTTAETEIRLVPITWGTVRGTVRDASSGELLAGATVRIGGAEVETDASGAFVLEKVPAGEGAVAAALARYHDTQSRFDLPRDGDIEQHLQLAPITTGTVIVTVVDAGSGNPISGASLAIGEKQLQTDAAGQARVEEVAAGRVIGNASATLYEPGSAETRLEAASEATLTIPLTPVTYGTIAGTVLDAVSDAPIGAATVRIGAQSTRTDDSGRFELERVNAGDVGIAASKPVYVDNSVTISLAAGATETVTVRLDPVTWGSIAGVVTDAETGVPLANADVAAGTQRTTSDSAGRFRFDELPAGTVTVAGTLQAYESGSTVIELAPAAEQDVSVALTPIKIGDIRGIVVDAKTGEPIAQARITAGTQSSESDAGGRFSFSSIKTGNTSVAAQHPDYANGATAVEVVPADTVSVEIRLDLRREDVTNLEAELAKTGSIDLYGIYFDSGKAQFKPSSLNTLRAVLEVMKRAPERRFRIAGHTDSDGGDDYNQNLSERRAQTVIQWLIDNGIDSARLDGVGFGETKPAAPNDTLSGKALNRRVQLSFAD